MRGSVGYLSNTAVYKTWSMQLSPEKYWQGTKIPEGGMLHHRHQKYSALRWAAVWATSVQFKMVRMCSEKQKIQLTPWEPSSISFIHWVPGFPVAFIPPKLTFGDVLYKTWSTSRWQSSHLIQTCQCCFVSSSSSLGCPQSCWWLFWHFWWCSQSPHFSSGHKSLKLNCCTVSKKLRN